MTVTMTAVAQGVIDAAAAETKAWLRIEMASDDATIASLVRAAIGMAEDFCAQMMFARTGTETLTAGAEWRRMRACPVRSITAARVLGLDGTMSVLAADAYAIDIGADGDGWFRLRQQSGESRVEADLTAGVASDWQSLPDPLRQGIVRLAAHLFVEREASGPAPAIVTALWRPWRRMRMR